MYIYTFLKNRNQEKKGIFKDKESIVKSKHFESRHQMEKKTGKQTDT